MFFLNKMVAFTHGMVAIASATGSRNSTCCRGSRAVRMFGEHFVCFTIDVLGDPISSIVTWANEDAQGNWQSLMTLVALIIP